MTDNTRCPFPYTNEPACDQTIADAGGNTYKAFMAGWLCGVLILFILTIIQFIRMLRIRGYSWELFYTSYTHQMFTISLYNCLTLVIRMIDPLNWSGRLHFTFVRILKDTSTWAAYSLTLLCVCSWVKIMYQITGRSPHNVTLIERITIIGTFLFFFIFAFLQSYLEKSYMAYAIQLFICVVYAVLLIVVAWVHGLRVYCHLARYEAQSASTSSNTTSSPTLRSKSSIRANYSAQKKRTRIIILLRLIVVMTICMLAAIGLQFYFATSALKNKYHRINNPEPYPQYTFGHLLNLSGFTIVQALASVSVLIFVRKFGSSRDMSSADTSMKSQSDHTQNNKTTNPMTKQPSSPADIHHIEMTQPYDNTTINPELLSSPTHMHSSSASVNVDAVVLDMSSPSSAARPGLPTHPNTSTYKRSIIQHPPPPPSAPHPHPFQPQPVPSFEQPIDMSNMIQHARNSSSSNQHTPRSASQSTPRKPATNHI